MTLYNANGYSSVTSARVATVLSSSAAIPSRSLPIPAEKGRLVPTGTQGWKRVLDVAFGGAALVALSPVLAVAALAVKFTSPGPVLFCQERIGLNRRTSERRRSSMRAAAANRRGGDRRVLVSYGKPFKMFKFRTMVADAEKGRPVWAQKNDARITRVGRFLRRTRIDEIPQFVNVLKGDMSIVGPRPERAYFMAQIDKELPEFKQRLRTKPGITGLAQVELGYTNTAQGMRHKLGFDLDYIRRLAPMTDLRILYKTVSVVITGKGAY